MASASGGQLQPRSNLLPEMICRNHHLSLTKSARERQLDGVELQRLPTMIGTLGFATIEDRQVLDTAKFDLAGDLRGRPEYSQFESPFGEPTLYDQYIIARRTVVSDHSCSYQIFDCD